MNPKLFTLLQSDVDGAGLKVMNFARSLALMQPADKRHDPVTKHERQVGAPSLRNVGFQLVHLQRAEMLKNTFTRQKDFNDKAASIQSGGGATTPELFAEDTVRGFRIDIWDDTPKQWRSLCRRIAHYDLNSSQVIVDVPEEEGTVRLAATKSSDKTSNPDLLWLHEAFVSWSGWSLSAPVPGKTIQHHRDDDKEKDHHDQVAEPEAEVPPGLRLATAFKVLPGSLPRLRYGRKYWIRARVVDLAGNSLPPNPNVFPVRPDLSAGPHADEEAGRHARDPGRRRIDGAHGRAHVQRHAPAEHDSDLAAHAPRRRAVAHDRAGGGAAWPSRSKRHRGSEFLRHARRERQLAAAGIDQDQGPARRN
jgi:hypothetical protein